MITGELSYDGINIFLLTSENNEIVILGSIFIFVALLFKIAAAPFHM